MRSHQLLACGVEQKGQVALITWIAVLVIVSHCQDVMITDTQSKSKLVENDQNICKCSSKIDLKDTTKLYS